MKKIRVAHITYSDNKGGAAIAVQRLNRCLRNNKEIFSKIYGVNINQPFSEKLISNLFTFFYFLFCRIFEILIRKTIYFNSKTIHSFNLFSTNINKRMSEFNPDIIHLHYIASNTISLKDIFLFKKPVIWTFHDMWAFLDTAHLDYKKIKKKKNILENFIDSKVRALKKKYLNRKFTIIAPSCWMKKEVCKSDLFKNQSIHVVPNTIDTKIWKSTSKKNIKKNDSYNEIFTLGYCVNGIHQVHKGYDLFQKIIKNLDKILKHKIRLICFGDNNFRKKIFVTKNVDIIIYPKLSKEDKLIKIYSSLDLLMVTSRVESFCQVALESMACSTPVIAFKVGGLIDLIEHKKTGFLIENFNVSKYVNTINFYLKKFRSNEIKRNSRIVAEKKFDFKVVKKKYIKIYKNIYQK